jgi:2-polyprenyl-3-methyl-5-hydroxy-6-metoxy-1,4-benzoquinol methylase
MVHRNPPGPGYVHPRAHLYTEHARGLEVADESTPNYHLWVASLCRPYLGDRVLEIGAGRGAVTRFLSEGVLDYIASDATPECLTALERRFAGSQTVTVKSLDVGTDQPDGQFDSIVMINVLEHLRDDADILRSLSAHLTENGVLIIYVPALNALFGDWDDWAGHYRRYSKPHLAQVMTASGLSVIECRYVNLMAIPAWYAFSRLGIRNKESGPDRKLGRDLRLWDRSAVPLTQWIETRWRPPIGLNVLGVARRLQEEADTSSLT